MLKINSKIVERVLNTPLPQLHTRIRLDGVKFYLILSCYALAFLLFSMNGFFHTLAGQFLFSQGTIVIFLSFILVSAFAWDALFLGEINGCNLILHLALMVPLSLFLALMLCSPTNPVTLQEQTTFLGEIWSATKALSMNVGISNLLESIVQIVPTFIRDFFTHFRSALVLLALLFAFCFHKTLLQFSLVSLILLIAFISTLQSHIFTPSSYLALGVLMIGIALHVMPYYPILIRKKMTEKLLQSDTLTVSAHTLFLSITEDAIEHIITRESILAKLRSAPEMYAQNNQELNEIADWVLEKMTKDLHLLQPFIHHEHVCYTLHDSITIEDSFFRTLARLPRLIFTLIVMCIWVLSPIDLIPDALPIVGLLDDMCITILAGFICLQANQKNHHLPQSLSK